jgi:ABC-type branched-subunit amino acid transport system substrate-binding protein
MERAQMTPIFELAVAPDIHDPGSLADRVRTFAPDALVMRLRPDAIRRLLAALQEVGVDCDVFLPWIPDLRLVEFPPAYGGPVVDVAPFRSRQQCGPYLKLVRSGIRRHGTRPTVAMVYGYDAGNLVIEALRRHAGGRTELQRELTGLSGFWGASGPIRWDNGGGNTAKPVVRVVSTGRDGIFPTED